MSESVSIEARLPVEQIEIRPGRRIAVHHRPGHGTGYRLIFVHGSCASMLQFEPMISHFAAAGQDVVAFDLVGCGRSPKPRCWYAYAFHEFAADLEAVVVKYGKQPARNVLVCHSAGCWLGLNLVNTAISNGREAPTAGMCLMGAGYVGKWTTPPIFYLPAIVLGWMQPLLSASFETMALHQKTHDGATKARRQARALAKEVNASNPPYMFKAYYRQIVTPDEEQVRRVGRGVPITLVAGDSDMLVPRAATEALRALLPAATPIHAVPDSSHQHMQEEPAVCIEILNKFMAGL
mmetsp:Transcript_46259/g.107719  ORF Transcript_46259/g.107719 Transcript_46259/m.107719 type:complete len:293 (-) Transcript_46259:68-946(-)|eukprot:CAMPEP_0119359642 /NCGR_PEP_ID=MMETSP1334-20130426/7485_1 /TAXON_ID=127549 /ORGANISM="Calcidiscus leptoporus, Strain RCC1130" /LENGTH=292 /DNA_ID=CAMNT_0007374351 /DNA_START=87 /DNA_END=965 /DNA_ORIENTATION=+